MFYGYENLNYDYSQISEMVQSGEYTDFKLDRIFTEKEFKRTNDGRIIPQSTEEDAEEALYNLLVPGDTVITSSLMNFSASTDGIIMILNKYLDKGARILAVKEHFDSDQLDRKTLELFTAVSEEAHRLRRASQKRGIEAAIEAGRYGRQVTIENFPKFEEYYLAFQEHRITKTEMAIKLQISRPTLNKLIFRAQQARLAAYAERITKLSKEKEST